MFSENEIFKEEKQNIDSMEDTECERTNTSAKETSSTHNHKLQQNENQRNLENTKNTRKYCVSNDCIHNKIDKNGNIFTMSKTLNGPENAECSRIGVFKKMMHESYVTLHMLVQQYSVSGYFEKNIVKMKFVIKHVY